MKFGIGLPIVQQVPARAQAWESGAGVEELVRVARAADRTGFGWIGCSDHIAVPSSYAAAMGATWYEPVATLGFLAASTERVRLLSHVMVLPYRHPLLLAKAFSTLDALSAGRVIVGVGVGHLKPEFHSLGVPYELRAAQAHEALEALVAAFAAESSSFEGSFFRWRDMITAPRAPQRPRPPIWAGGNGRAAVRRAVRLADGWIPWELAVADLRELVAYGREVEAGAERRTPLEIVAPLGVSVEDGAGEVRDRAGALREAGATALHLGVASRSLEHLIERMEWLGGDVLAPAG